MALTKVIGSGLGAVTQDGAATFNEGGADVDFRVESDTKTHALFVDGALGNVGIGVVPISSWNSSWTVLQLGATGFVGQFQASNTDVTGLGSNVFFACSGADFQMFVIFQWS